MNLPISADFPDMCTYNPSVLDDENNRLKSLLIATIAFYILGGGLGFWFGKFLYSDTYIIWTFEKPWIIWVTWVVMFLTFSWIPLSAFLFWQGIVLRKKYSENAYPGDRTIGNLSVFVPVVFASIYIFTRVFY